MIDFLRFRKFFFIFSGILTGFGLISFILKGKDNFGIDFMGGTMLHLKFEKQLNEADINSIRKKIEASKIRASIQYFGGEKKELIVKAKGVQEDVSLKIREIIETIGDFEYSSEYIGPSVSRDLVSLAIKAVIIAIIAMLIYIAIRFEFRFGISAVIALIHDITFVLGIYSLTGCEFNVPTIAAFLTVVGYSINDTIVVFDRIRENLKLLRREDYYIIVNKSINQVLPRTIITSLTTLFVCSALLIFAGGEVSKFALVLVVGVIIGTYSSDCVASPILYEWHKRSQVKK
ncbi:TPA: protein translocase subunit SecF [bacterium]|nr:protein translocase subunit SecF [bacterium]